MRSGRAHDLGLSTGGVIAAYIAFNAVYAAAAYPAGVLSDRVPRHLVFALSLVFFAVGYLGLGLVDDTRWAHQEPNGAGSDGSRRR